MKNVLKIVFLGILGFGLLTYLTAPKNVEKNLEKVENKTQLSINSIPRYFELVEHIINNKEIEDNLTTHRLFKRWAKKQKNKVIGKK